MFVRSWTEATPLAGGGCARSNHRRIRKPPAFTRAASTRRRRPVPQRFASGRLPFRDEKDSRDTARRRGALAHVLVERAQSTKFRSIFLASLTRISTFRRMNLWLNSILLRYPEICAQRTPGTWPNKYQRDSVNQMVNCKFPMFINAKFIVFFFAKVEKKFNIELVKNRLGKIWRNSVHCLLLLNDRVVFILLFRFQDVLNIHGFQCCSLIRYFSYLWSDYSQVCGSVDSVLACVWCLSIIFESFSNLLLRYYRERDIKNNFRRIQVLALQYKIKLKNWIQ